MTLAELKEILEATDFPVAYSHFIGEPPSIPFITYLTPGTSNFHADNKVLVKVTDADIELYTSIKDELAEKKLEDILNQHEIPWDVTETFIESEKLYQRIYEIGVI